MFLIGYMGSGKSTLGRLVAALTPLQFIDLDQYIENRHHKSISHIFEHQGEEEFRRIENNLLREVADFENVVVACGGGTPCFMDNMEIINSHGLSVWLEAPVDTLHDRLMKGRQKRPLIAGMDSPTLRRFIEDALRQRQPYYAKAQQRFNTARLDNHGDRMATARRFVDQIITPNAH